jgi:hypothetical protein
MLMRSWIRTLFARPVTRPIRPKPEGNHFSTHFAAAYPEFSFCDYFC